VLNVPQPETLLPKPPQTIALHIGAHKTATSHLQKTLHNNRKMLSAEGVRVVGPHLLRAKGRNLQAMFNLSWSESPAPRRAPRDQLAFLARGHKRLVFSEENFVGVLADKAGRVSLPLYPAGPERVAELAAAWAPIKPQLFVAVRNPASYLASAYSQTLLGGAHVGPRTFRARNDWRLINWADYIAKFRAISDISDIYVWRQEDYDRTQGLILRRLLGWKVGGKVERVDGRVHLGLSAAAVRQTLQWAQEGKTEKVGTTARGLFPINDDNKPFALYARSTLDTAQAIYAAQMAQIEAMEGVTVLHPPAAAQKG
jgi:hypothetical protein